MLARSLGHTIKPTFVAFLPDFLVFYWQAWSGCSAGVEALGEFGPGKLCGLTAAVLAAGPEQTNKLLAIPP